MLWQAARMPRISVVIPTRGRAEGLERTLSAISSPPEWNTEVIVVENHTDAAKVIAESAGVRYVRLAEGNASTARNFGAEVAGPCDVLVFLDDDSVPDPMWLRELVTPILAQQADATVGTCTVVFEEPVVNSIRAYFVDTDLALDPSHPFIIGMNAAMSREAFECVGGFPVNLGPGASMGGEDLWVSLRLRQLGFGIIATPQAVVRHEIPASRVTSSGLRDRMVWAGKGEGWIAVHCQGAAPSQARLGVRIVRTRLRLFLRPSFEEELRLTLQYWRERQMLTEIRAE